MATESASRSSLRIRHTLFGDYHRSFVRLLILLALFAAAFVSQILLLSHQDGFSSRATMAISAASPSTAAATSSLPLTHRRAGTSECVASRSTNFAPASSTPKVSLHDQQQFARGGYKLIARGSGEVTACGPIVSVLSRLQHSRNLYGTLGEFGVHHGRFTGFLFITARDTEKLIVGDLFGQQDKNVDKSGLGDKRMFMRGLLTYGLHPRAIHAVIEASTDELPFDLTGKALMEPFRIVSVDASHTAAFTFNDLQLAFCNLLTGGIVILDDWFHSTWPGVVEGFYQFVDHAGVAAKDVYPFLICESKLFLTNDKEMHQLYYDTLKSMPEFQSFVSPYAHEKDRGKLEYEMLGHKYLKCVSRSGGNMQVKDLQQLWAGLVY
ncbi:hypothetical protein MPSEU_000830300 [Mayamaea pseudoterrestris]|nr:hypothetical protein MPSEU_000830300 [Mayamaea pseudoterrestris]